MTKLHSLLSLPHGDPVVALMLGSSVLPWLPSLLTGLVSGGGSQHRGHPSDCPSLASCREDLECQGHDRQQWPL